MLMLNDFSFNINVRGEIFAKNYTRLRYFRHQHIATEFKLTKYLRGLLERLKFSRLKFLKPRKIRKIFSLENFSL